MVSLIVDLFKFSPNGVYLACALHTEKQVLIRKCTEHTTGSGTVAIENRFKITHTFSLNKRNLKTFPLVPVDSLVWSSDSSFLAVGCKRYGVISVFSVLIGKGDNWRCTVNLGENVGLESFVWGSDARHLICMANNFDFLSIWPLTADKQVGYVKDICPIANCKGISFSADCQKLAVVKAHLSSDNSEYETIQYFIAIHFKLYKAQSIWKETFNFGVISKDPTGISWNPSGSEFICIWDSHLYSNLYIYSALTGAMIRHYSPYGVSSAGFHSVEWSGTGDFLVATVRNKNEIHVLNGLTFGVLIHDVLEPNFIEFNDELTESPKTETYFEPQRHSNLGMHKYNRLSKWPAQLKIDPTLAIFSNDLKSLANTQAKVSYDGTLLACTSSNFYPRILWIYDLVSAVCPIAILIHQNPILDFNWNPMSNKLAIVCGNGYRTFNANDNNSTFNSNGLLYFWGKSSSCAKSSMPKTWIHNTTSTKICFTRIHWNYIGDLLLVEDTCQKIHLFPNL